MVKSIKHLDSTILLMLMKKFNITSEELSKIEELGFKYDEKIGWFVLEHDDPCSKDCLIIKNNAKEYKIEHEEYLYDGDGCFYTNYNKTTPYMNQTLIQFLDMVYNNDTTFVKQ